MIDGGHVGRPRPPLGRGISTGVYLLGVIQNMINQVGSLTSSIQSVVSGLFLLVVVVLQTLLSPDRGK